MAAACISVTDCGLEVKEVKDQNCGYNRSICGVKKIIAPYSCLGLYSASRAAPLRKGLPHGMSAGA